MAKPNGHITEKYPYVLRRKKFGGIDSEVDPVFPVFLIFDVKLSHFIT